MRYHAIDNKLFTANRKNLVKELSPNSIVIIHANDIYPTNADGVMPFKQNSELFYLSGIDQEETILILAPDFPDPKMREMLFLRETNEMIATWEGHKLTQDEGTETSGIKNIKWTQEFEHVLHTLLAECDNLYLPSNEHIRSTSRVETSNDRFIKWCMDRYPLFNYRRLSPLLYKQRMIKSPIEVKLLEHACHITETGFRRILEVVKPGVWEYEVEAEYAHAFISNRSKGFAYTPIIAGGGSSCVLHYIENNRQLKDCDLLLMDVGAEYANYNSDMTRTIPVSGKFTKRQRQVYEAVLRVKNQATELLTSGNSIPKYHKEVGEIMTGELIDLGLIDKTDVKNQDPISPAYRKYFMHGTSHHLGLDVHDVGSVYQDFAPGMVFTVEPGIYIPQENIGIRLEDNILITKEGTKNLMRNIPIHVDEIEDLMNRK